MEIGDYLTVPEAAEHLSVGVSAIHNAVAQGRLSVNLIYGRKLVRRADLETYKQRTQPGGVKKVGRPRKDVQAEPSRRSSK